MLHEEICKIKRALKAAIDGAPFTEAFNEEFYLESLSQMKVSASNHLSIVIKHLLKIKYCTNYRNCKTWANSIEVHRRELINAT